MLAGDERKARAAMILLWPIVVTTYGAVWLADMIAAGRRKLRAVREPRTPTSSEP